MTIRWVLLGPGRHADNRVAPQMSMAADTAMHGVLSRDRARGEAFAKKHGFETVYGSFAEVLRDNSVDAVYDATPDGLHLFHAEECAKAGKHILIEKPLAMSVADGAAAVATCRTHGVTLGVVFNQRHEAAHIEAKRIAAAGEIGEVKLASVQLPFPRLAPPGPAPATWRSDPNMRSGGIAASIGDHAFDTLSYIVGQEIAEVTAFTDATRDTPPNDQVAGLLLKLAKGAIGHATASFRTPFARRPFEIHGTKGTLILTNTYDYLVGADGDPTLEIIDERGRSIRQFPITEFFRREIERFNRAIEGKDTPMTPGEDGMRAQATVEAVYHAMRNRCVARVADFLPKTA